MPKEFSHSEEFRRLYATSVFGGFSIYDLRMTFIDLEDGHPVSQAEVIMNPLAAKQLSTWLAKQVSEYEKMFGKIRDKPLPKAKMELEKNKSVRKKNEGYS